jgi:ATP-binding cassette subfamily B protein
MENSLRISFGEATRKILNSGIIILFLLAVYLVCQYFVLYYGHVIGAEMGKDMRSEIFDHYQKLSFSFYDEQKTANLISRATLDLYNVSEFLHHFPEEILLFFLRIVGVFIMFFLINWRLAISSVISFPIMIIFLSYLMPKMKNGFLKMHNRVSEINSQLEDSLSGIRVVKSFANENIEKQKLEFTNCNFMNCNKEYYELMAKNYSMIFTIVTSMLPIVAIAGIFLIKINLATSGELVAFMLWQSEIIGPIFGLIERLEQSQNTLAGFDRFFEILNTKPKIINSPNAVDLKNVSGDICFKNVFFNYENDLEIFSNLNLKIKSGEFVAIVGLSGTGKSTFCNLIPRFYEVNSGQISIDGINIRNVKLESLRKNIGFVQQDVFIFSGTVMENIRYGNPIATDQEVIEAAKKSYSHNFIVDLPNSYETDIGQRGVKLSGGQRQRLAIARVFLKNPPILIFDEATSSLDNENEKYIHKSLEELTSGRTTIMIAHRLSTIRNAKRILVLSDGKIVEEGTHEKLISKNGVYLKLYNSF